MLEKIKRETIKVVFYAKFVSDTDMKSLDKDVKSSEIKTGWKMAQINIPSLLKKVRRNSPCPCGSGKKFKHCCGAI